MTGLIETGRPPGRRRAFHRPHRARTELVGAAPRPVPGDPRGQRPDVPRRGPRSDLRIGRRRRPGRDHRAAAVHLRQREPELLLGRDRRACGARSDCPARDHRRRRAHSPRHPPRPVGRHPACLPRHDRHVRHTGRRDEHRPLRHHRRRQRTDHRVGQGPSIGARDGPRFDRRPHDVRLRSWPCSASTSRPTPWTGAASAPPPTSTATRIELDFADVAAVVDAVAARTGGPVALWGHSYGANCAMGGAASHRQRQPPRPLRTEPRPAISARLDRTHRTGPRRGDHDAAIVAVLVDILEMTDDEIDAFRANPLWPVRLAAAPTVPRECRVEQDWVYQTRHFESITAPTLVLTGSDSVPDRHGSDRAGRRRHPRRPHPRARRPWPLRPQDRPRHGRRDHPQLRRLLNTASAHDRLSSVASPSLPLRRVTGR